MYHVFIKIDIFKSIDITLQYTHIYIYKKKKKKIDRAVRRWGFSSLNDFMNLK